MKKFLSFFLLSGLLMACSQETILPDVPNESDASDRVLISMDEYTSLVMAHAQKMSSEEASSMLNGFLNGISSSERSAKNFSIRLKETEYLSIDGKAKQSRSVQEENIPFYRFEVIGELGKGFAIVSGDGRCPGVVAYIPQGNLDSLDVYDGANMMMELSEESVVEEISRIQNLVDSLKDKTIEKVSALCPDVEITEENIRYHIVTNGSSDLLYSPLQYRYSKSPTYDEPATLVIYKEGPYITTQWHQDSPYNGLLPQSYHQAWGMNIPGNYPLGCGVVAGMQVLAYLKPSMTIDGLAMDWNKLTANPEIRGGAYSEELVMAQALAKHVYEGTKTTPNIMADGKYGPYDDKDIPIVTSSSTKVAELIAFLNKYVQCGDYYERFASDAMLNAIKGKHVSIMGGTSQYNTNHAWIMDGFAICQKSTREILRQYDLYFHANMGQMGGDYTGYYKVNPDVTISFQLGDRDSTCYDKNFWVISDIRPK